MMTYPGFNCKFTILLTTGIFRFIILLYSDMSMIYLDYAATTPLHPAVNTYMHEIGEIFYANPSSLHSAGQRSKVLLENARQLISASYE